ncbi:Asp23/Gls24 family envelope stress response protein, partial [Enterococcus faecalis]
VALEMQDRVKEQALFMTDIDLVEVNIHVVAPVPEKITQPDLNELFPEDEDGKENE